MQSESFPNPSAAHRLDRVRRALMRGAVGAAVVARQQSCPPLLLKKKGRGSVVYFVRWHCVVVLCGFWLLWGERSFMTLAQTYYPATMVPSLSPSSHRGPFRSSSRRPHHAQQSHAVPVISSSFLRRCCVAAGPPRRCCVAAGPQSCGAAAWPQCLREDEIRRRESPLYDSKPLRGPAAAIS